MFDINELSQIPSALQEAVNAKIQSFNQYNRSYEIISMTKIELNRPEAPGQKKQLYRVIMFVLNTFFIFEQTINDGYDLGVSQDILTIGAVKEIIDRAPSWTGLRE